jgi:hypothetical protein
VPRASLSPEAALWQAPRVAAARHVAVERIRALVAELTEGRDLGVLEEPRVNVLLLNLALDRRMGPGRRRHRRLVMLETFRSLLGGAPRAAPDAPLVEEFTARAARARDGVRPLLDLTVADPARCALGWDPAELEEIVAAARSEPSRSGLREAQEAVAGYLAGRGAAVAPERVVLAPSSQAAVALLVEARCAEGEEVLVPSPARPLELPVGSGARTVPYVLQYDGAWRLDQRSIARGASEQTRAVVVASPAEPTGALLGPGDLAFLEELCAARGLALVGDETFADEALGPAPSVAARRGCLAFHVASAAGACGLPGAGAAWIAAAGPEPLVAPAMAQLPVLARARCPIDPVARRALPALLGRRERFLGQLRARLATNRATLATAALREAPWSLLAGAGGWSAVLQIGAAQDAHALCLELLDRGVLVHPGYLYGLPRNGFLVVSLLPPPELFRGGLECLEERLRDRLFG